MRVPGTAPDVEMALLPSGLRPEPAARLRRLPCAQKNRRPADVFRPLKVPTQNRGVNELTKRAVWLSESATKREPMNGVLAELALVCRSIRRAYESGHAHTDPSGFPESGVGEERQSSPSDAQ